MAWYQHARMVYYCNESIWYQDKIYQYYMMYQCDILYQYDITRQQWYDISVWHDTTAVWYTILFQNCVTGISTFVCWPCGVLALRRSGVRRLGFGFWPNNAVILKTLHWRHNGHDGVSNHQPHHCLLHRLFRRTSKKTSKLCVTGLCEGNSPVTGEFPAQMASYVENVSIWWRHHEIIATGDFEQKEETLSRGSFASLLVRNDMTHFSASFIVDIYLLLRFRGVNAGAFYHCVFFNSFPKKE